ncbi:MAG: ABC transporter permease [Acidobacteriota bacterium]
MNGFLAILGRELRAYFVSPLAWVVLTFLLFVQGWAFSLIVSFLADPRTPAGTTPFDVFFGSFFFWFTLLFVTPVITMRSIAEERRSGTLETLMTGPVTETQVVLAKFTAALAFYAFLWAPTALYPVIIGRHTAIDWGPLAAGYLGTLLLGAMALSVGLLASALSKNQIVAAVATFGTLLMFFALPWAGDLVRDPVWTELFAYLSQVDHLDEMARGIVDSRRLTYYLTTTALFLFFTTRALEAKKWR